CEIAMNHPFKVKSCASSNDCQIWSLNFGSAKISSSCCDTDLCNGQDPPESSSNGKKCYSCDEKRCSNILSCTGSEDQCLKATGKSMVLKGCVSEAICNATTSVPDVQSISCCEGNLCNGAKSVTQSFLFLCCSLLSFILLH
uniref:Urokinase plasminogen activator surface receptor-like n=1 Tax=Sinocyclocheilus grahami TaxID=75366 RepID=A0A672PR90_SINGR